MGKVLGDDDTDDGLVVRRTWSDGEVSEIGVVYRESNVSIVVIVAGVKGAIWQEGVLVVPSDTLSSMCLADQLLVTVECMDWRSCQMATPAAIVSDTD